MKVVLVQLPVPDNRYSNLPLALGYLKAAADSANIPGLQVTLLQAPIQNRAGDALLIDTILSHDPDLVGFSLYTWNSSRALGLAKTLKQLAPEVLLLAGGPEINHDGDWVLSSPHLDFLVQGEGERTFVQLLQSLNSGSRGHSLAPYSDRLGGIKGLGIRLATSSLHFLGEISPEAAGWQFSSPQPALEDVNLVPSAYLSGALEGYVGRFMSIELSRWCPSKCTFCYYGRQDLPRGGKRYFDLERVRQELLFGIAHGVEQVHFVEANFNSLPHLEQLYSTIKESGANRQMSFYAELRGEAITDYQADLLAACNFGTVEVGLQSAVPEVLARVRRKNNLPRLVQGVHNLRSRGIEVFLDVILGLPGETPETFQRTLDFIGQHDLEPYDLFHLQMLPGTQLKAEVREGQHGIRYQPAPPYFVLETAELSFEALCELRRGVLNRKGFDPSVVGGVPQPGPFSLEESPDHGTGVGNEEVIERVIIDLSSNPALLLPSGLARRLGSEVTLWLKLGAADEFILSQAERTLQLLSEPNPSGIWQLFVQADRPLTPAEQIRLSGAIRHEEGYLDRLGVFAQVEKSKVDRLRWPSVNFFQILPYRAGMWSQADSNTVWQVTLDETKTLAEWKSQLRQAIQASGAGIYVVTSESKSSLSKWKALYEDLELGSKRLWLADWTLAAGVAAWEASDSTDTITNLDYPLTASLGGRQSSYRRPAKAQLERAAIAYQLATPAQLIISEPR